MKNAFIILAILFLSCKDTDASNKIETVSTSITEILTKPENGNSEANIEKEVNNSDGVKAVLYKGTLNGTIKISLYINEQESPCGGNKTIINAMYKYDNQEKWILLNVTTNQKKINYAMVENGFSGALFLQANGTSFSGVWISPDAKKKFNVLLEKAEIDNATLEKMDEILFDDLIFSKNDC